VTGLQLPPPGFDYRHAQGCFIFFFSSAFWSPLSFSSRRNPKLF